MNIFSLISYTAFIFYFAMGIVALKSGRRENVNIVFSLLTFSFALWSFGITFYYSSETVEECYFWFTNFSAGWFFFPAFLIHFFILLTKVLIKTGKIKIFIRLFIILNYIIGLYYTVNSKITNVMINDFVKSDLGWIIKYNRTPAAYFFILYMTFSVVFSIFLTVIWHIKSDTKREKKQSTIILISFLTNFTIFYIVSVIFPFTGFSLPPIGPSILTIWIFGILYAMLRFRFLTLTYDYIKSEILNNITDVIIILDVEYKIISGNRRFVNSLNHTINYLIGKSIFEVLNISLSDLNNGEVIHLNNDSYEIKIEDVKDKFNDHIGYFIAGSNVTDKIKYENEYGIRKTAEENIKMLYSAIESSGSIVVITDINGSIEYVNPKFTRVTGYSFDEVNGKKINLLRSDEYPNDFYYHFWETLLSDGEWSGEFKNKKKNGEYYWEKSVVSSMKSVKGEIVKFIKVAEDITIEKKSEDEIIKNMKLESLGILAGGIAHDFNNLLMGIIGNLTLSKNFIDDKNELLNLLTSAENASMRLLQKNLFFCCIFAESLYF